MRSWCACFGRRKPRKLEQQSRCCVCSRRRSRNLFFVGGPRHAGTSWRAALAHRSKSVPVRSVVGTTPCVRDRRSKGQIIGKSQHEENASALLRGIYKFNWFHKFNPGILWNVEFTDSILTVDPRICRIGHILIKLGIPQLKGPLNLLFPPSKNYPFLQK